MLWTTQVTKSRCKLRDLSVVDYSGNSEQRQTVGSECCGPTQVTQSRGKLRDLSVVDYSANSE